MLSAHSSVARKPRKGTAMRRSGRGYHQDIIHMDYFKVERFRQNGAVISASSSVILPF
jgi:hypothetical protein